MKARKFVSDVSSVGREHSTHRKIEDAGTKNRQGRNTTRKFIESRIRLANVHHYFVAWLEKSRLSSQERQVLSW